MKKNTPIIVANTQWPLPNRLVKEVKAERMITALCDLAKPNILDYKEFVGDAECLAYLMPETNRRPISGHWANIYLFLATRVIKRWKIEEALPKDCKVETISDYEQGMLDNLKFSIYKSRGGKEKNVVVDTLKKVFLNNPPK